MSRNTFQKNSAKQQETPNNSKGLVESVPVGEFRRTLLHEKLRMYFITRLLRSNNPSEIGNYCDDVWDKFSEEQIAEVYNELHGESRAAVFGAVGAFESRMRSLSGADIPDNKLMHNLAKYVAEKPELLSIQKYYQFFDDSGKAPLGAYDCLQFSDVLLGVAKLSRQIISNTDVPKLVSAQIVASMRESFEQYVKLIQNSSQKTKENILTYSDQLFECMCSVDESILDDLHKIFQDYLYTPPEYLFYHKLQLLSSSHSSIVQNYAIQVAQEMIHREHGIENFPVQSSIDDKKYTIVDNGFFANQLERVSRIDINMKLMKDIEARIPGSVKKLVEDYGIEEFYRYPPRLLELQIKQEHIDMPFMLIIMPRSDKNRAFDHLSYMYVDLLKQTAGKLAIKVIECGGKDDLKKRMGMIKEKFCTTRKISLGILGGHGTEGKLLNLGDLSDIFVYKDDIHDDYIIHQDIRNHPSLKAAMPHYFEDYAQFLAISCKAGVKGGIAEKATHEFGYTTIAPKINANVFKLQLQLDFDEYDNTPSFGLVGFDGNEENTAIYKHK